jgi:hypothetical protein
MNSRQTLWLLRGSAVAIVALLGLRAIGPWWLIIPFGVALFVDAFAMLHGVIRP